MVKDIKSGTCHRADKVIEEHIEKILTKKHDLKPEERKRLTKIMDDAGSMHAE